MAAKSAGTVTITMRAGNAQFQRDVDQGAAKLRDFGKAAQQSGQHVQGSMAAASASIRLLEGNVTHSLRAVERFLATTAGLGPALQAIFPVVGAIAFAGVIGEMGKQVYDFFKAIRQAPERIGGMFRELNGPLRTVNDELAVTNERLVQDIAKLEGKRQNTLQLALFQARVEADKLADSLDRDLSALEKLLKEQQSGFWKSLVSGSASTKDIAKEIGGESGFGGFRGQVAQITDEGIDRIKQATDADAKKAAQTALNTRLQAAYATELAKVDKLLAEATERSKDTRRYETSDKSKTLVNPQGVPSLVGHAALDERQRLEMLAGVRRNLLTEQASIGLRAANVDLTGKKAELEANRDNSKLDRPFENKIEKLKAEIQQAQFNLDSAGLDGAAKVIAKAHGDAVIAIEEVIKANKRLHVTMQPLQKQEIEDLMLKRETILEEDRWKTKLALSTAQIRDQIHAQELLTAAIGRGFEATKAASVETAVMRKVGPEAFNDPRHAADIAQVRADEFRAFDAANTEKASAAADKLGDQLELERALLTVQAQGAEAIRLVTLAYRLKEITATHGLATAKELIKAEIDLYNAQRATTAAAEIAKITDRIDAVKKLSAAVLEGAEAERRAALENKYAEMQRAGATPEVVQAQRQQDQGEHELAITSKVAERVDVYKNHLEQLNQEVARLRLIDVTEKNRLDIARAYRDLQNETLHVMVEQTLAMKGARDGVRAFFLEMQTNSRNTAVIMYDTMNKAVDGIAGSIGKLATRQKAGFGEMFKGIGEGLVQNVAKQQLQRGLGALGKVFGIDPGKLAKPDGTKGNPLWVQLAGAAGALGLPGAGGGGLFGGGDQGGGIFSLLGAALIPHAAGGPVSPSSAYLVGEHGPEILTGASGRIMNNAETRRTLGGGGPVHYYSIDARGTDPVQTEMRVRTAIVAAHNSAVGTAVRANHDQVRRMPAGARA